MVNVSGRSKGCATCRRRKIKCDQTFPECQRCVQARLPCPGPRAGAFFVHAGPVPSHATIEAPQSYPTDNSAGPVGLLVAYHPHQQGPAAVPLPPAAALRPYRAAAFDQLFLSHFISSFGQLTQKRFAVSENSNWLASLPSYLSAPDNSLAKSSIRAASMLSYSAWSGDASIKMPAYQIYSTSLLRLRAGIAYPSQEMLNSTICAAVMMIHFEVYAATSHDAWIQHVNGATALLQAAGPTACQSGFLYKIFGHLRLQALVASMQQNSLSPLATQQWLSIPYLQSPANVFDDIVSVLFLIQRCLVASDVLRADDNISSRVSFEKRLAALTETIMRKLHDWENQFMPSNFASTVEGANHADALPPGLSGGTSPVADETSVPVVALASLFHAASILSLRLFAVHHPSHGANDEMLRRHSLAILSANDFISGAAGAVGGLGLLMTLPQLKILSLWGSTVDTRAAALERLGEKQTSMGAFDHVTGQNRGYFADLAAAVIPI